MHPFAGRRGGEGGQLGKSPVGGSWEYGGQGLNLWGLDAFHLNLLGCISKYDFLKLFSSSKSAKYDL